MSKKLKWGLVALAAGLAVGATVYYNTSSSESPNTDENDKKVALSLQKKLEEARQTARQIGREEIEKKMNDANDIFLRNQIEVTKQRSKMELKNRIKAISDNLKKLKDYMALNFDLIPFEVLQEVVSALYKTEDRYGGLRYIYGRFKDTYIIDALKAVTESNLSDDQKKATKGLLQMMRESGIYYEDLKDKPKGMGNFLKVLQDMAAVKPKIKPSQLPGVPGAYPQKAAFMEGFYHYY